MRKTLQRQAVRLAPGSPRLSWRWACVPEVTRRAYKAAMLEDNERRQISNQGFAHRKRLTAARQPVDEGIQSKARRFRQGALVRMQPLPDVLPTPGSRDFRAQRRNEHLHDFLGTLYSLAFEFYFYNHQLLINHMMIGI